MNTLENPSNSFFKGQYRFSPSESGISQLQYATMLQYGAFTLIKLFPRMLARLYQLLWQIETWIFITMSRYNTLWCSVTFRLKCQDVAFIELV